MKNNQKKRIGIDARFYGPLGKGLGRYTQEIVDNILKIDQDNDYVIFLRKENFDELVIDNHPNVKKVLLELRWYSLKEQLLMPFYLKREKLDLIHFCHFNVPFFVPSKFIVTIHDLILTKFKTTRASTLSPWLYNLKNFFYHIIIKRALKKSKKIITVSNFTKNDIIEQFKVPAQKIEVIYEGVANLSKGSDSLFVAKISQGQVLKNYNIENPFLLYVGNAYPHKNLDFLIRAFKLWQADDKELRLVLVGREDYFYNQVKELSAKLFSSQDNIPIIFTGYVPDNELETMYQRALLYVFPSLYEGFGLPPLEAMAKSCPVLSSQAASMPEILGSAAMYFDPQNENDFLEKAKRLRSDQELRESLIAKGLEQVKKYSWWECALSTKNLYLKQ